MQITKETLLARHGLTQQDFIGQGMEAEVYRLFSANTYAPDCSDGHYARCVRNLNTAAYWEQIA
jgi:hypothetical protein